MKSLFLKSTSAFILSLACAGAAETVLFQDNFESGTLGQWTGVLGGSHQGMIVGDPLRGGNQVLSFTGLNAGGDIFTSAALPVGENNTQYILQFDYLGQPGNGSVPGNLGGFIGLWISVTDPHYWMAGTDVRGLNTPIGIELTDDGAWYHYAIDITPIVRENGLTQVHLMVEDWNESGGVPGDAFFDNIQLIARSAELTLEDIVSCSGSAAGGSRIHARGSAIYLQLQGKEKVAGRIGVNPVRNNGMILGRL